MENQVEPGNIGLESIYNAKKIETQFAEAGGKMKPINQEQASNFKPMAG